MSENDKGYEVGRWHELDNYQCAYVRPGGGRCAFATTDQTEIEKHVAAHRRGVPVVPRSPLPEKPAPQEVRVVNDQEEHGN